MTPPAAWSQLSFFREVWPGLAPRLGGDWLPGHGAVFRALDLTPPEAVRVVILGQDPYPTLGHADGLAFSVRPGTPLPRSLANIFAEMRDDLGTCPASGDLAPLARQGVLLLNTSLSTPPGAAGGHARLGWQPLARQAILEAQRHGPLAFLLWGAHAQAAAAGLPRAQDFTLATAHPSPLSARRGFFGSRPFSRANAFLTGHGREAVDWRL